MPDSIDDSAARRGTASLEDKGPVSTGEVKGCKTSAIWEHFSKIVKEGTQKPEGAKCNYCERKYAWVSGNGTSTLRKHLKVCPKNPANKVTNKKQKTLSWGAVSKGEAESTGFGCWKFDQAKCREALAKMIIRDELPFRFVECDGFRYFCSVMQPDFKHVSRTTIARDIVTLYANEKMKMKNLFVKSNQRVCVTTDSWTSLQNISYMVVTAHFIDKDWKLHKRILNFCVIASHTGDAIGKALEACLIEWGIKKLCTVTVDNASANDVAVAYLKKKFSKGTFILGGEYLHMRCCAHIINLIVKDGLSEIKDSISRIRDIVKYVRSSPQREQRFKECIIKDKITCKSLVCLDVPTRWNSTYLMLCAAIKFRKSFERWEDEDILLKLELKDGFPTRTDWENAQFFSDFLELFYQATLKLSGSSYVTANLYFIQVCAIESFIYNACSPTKSVEVEDVFDKFLEEESDEMMKGDYSVENSAVKFMSLMAEKMKAKFNKYWGKIEKVNMMVLMAAVLDPQCKIKFIKFCYSRLYTPAKADFLCKMIKATLEHIYDEYKLVDDSGASSSRKSKVDSEVDKPIVVGADALGFLMTQFRRDMEEEEEGMEGKSEVDKYLEEPCEKTMNNFDILNWWKVNSSRYQVLSEIARDVLAIPVSTVASEAAFSTGGRVIDQFRSSLTPKIVECLICMEDWLRASHALPYLEENIEDIEEFELALNKV